MSGKVAKEGYNENMNTRIKATKFKLTNAIETYVSMRLAPIEKMLGADADTTRCEVEVGKDSGKHSSDYMWYAEMHVMTVGRKPLYARNHAASVNAAIDDVKEEIARQVRREKRMYQSRIKRGGREAKRQLKK